MDKQAIELTSKVSASSEVFSTLIGEDLVIFDPQAGNYFGSGDVGSRIWELIENEQQVSEICSKLVSEFEVERDVCEKQVIDFLSMLQDKELIKVI